MLSDRSFQRHVGEVIFVKRMRILLIFTLILVLLGCQNRGHEVGNPDFLVMAEQATSSASPIPVSTPTPTARPTETSTPTPTFTPTLTSTPTPFVCPEQQGTLVTETLKSVAMYGEEIRYTVYLPPCYAHDYVQQYRLPVLYLLHGWPMDETHWQELGVVKIADAWIAQGLIGPLMIVMPGVVNPHGMYINSSGGDFSFEGMLVNELLPLVDETYRTWQAPEGRALGGISRGGVWALEIGFRHPELFGKVGGHSPALAVNYPLPAYDPFRLLDSVDPRQRIYLSAGTQDWARGSTITLRDRLQEQGLEVGYQTHEGAHVDALWRLGLPEYLSFYTGDWPRSVEDLPTD